MSYPFSIRNYTKYGFKWVVLRKGTLATLGRGFPSSTIALAWALRLFEKLGYIK